MTLGDEQVLPAVVIVIDEVNAPGRVHHADRAYSGGRRDVLESALTVLVQRPFLVRQVADKYVRPSVVVVIFEADAHARVDLAVFVVSEPRRHPDLVEGAVVI